MGAIHRIPGHCGIGLEVSSRAYSRESVQVLVRQSGAKPHVSGVRTSIASPAFFAQIKYNDRRNVMFAVSLAFGS
jgi:hypothetical protein